MKRILPAGGLLPACLLLVSHVWAEDRLEPVLVSATRSEQGEVATAASITVVTREEIERSGARSIVEVLAGQPGVQLRDLYGNGTRATVSMRGFGGNAAANVLVLVDGRRLNNSDLAAPDLSAISLKDVERIEIVQGGAGVLFGDQAVGGVINVITRRARGAEADLEAGAGSYERQLLRARAAGQSANGLHYQVSGERQRADNYRDNNAEDYTNLFARLGLRHEHGDVFVEVQRSDEELGLPGGLFAAQVEEDRRQARYPDDYADTTTEVARIGILQGLGSHWRLEAEYTQRRSEGEGVLTGIDFTQNRDYRSLTPRLVGDLGEAHVTLGVDLDWNEYDFDAFGPTRSEQETRSAYALLILPAGERLDITAGIRRAVMDNELTDAFAFPNGVELDNDATAAELGASLDLTAGYRLFARAAQTYRFPKVDELTYTEPGEVGLQTQTGTSWELGVEWQRARAALKLLAYRLELRNEISFDPSANSGFGANINLDPTSRTGVIVEGGAPIAGGLSVHAQYSWVDARFDEGSFAGNDIPMVAEHQASLVLDYVPRAAWSLYGEIQYTSEQVADGDYANELDALDAYTVTNLGARLVSGPWRLSARVNNVFDENYSGYAVKDYNPWPAAETAYYPAPERNVMISAAYRFN